MKKNIFKRKGNVILTMLLFVMFIMIIAALFFSFLTSVDASRKAQKAAQIIAETRALAIDVRLKERYGYIEILHKPTPTYVYKTQFPVAPDFNTIQGYDNKILSPNDTAYKSAVIFADTSAKEAGISYIDGVTKNNDDGTGNTKLLEVKPENICIEVYSLPDTKISKEKLQCGPITTPSNPATVLPNVILPNDVPIYGSQHRLNGFTGTATDIQNDIRNYNYVFVLLTYQEKTFFYEAIQRFAHGEQVPGALPGEDGYWTPPPVKTVWAIAYPQIDFCFGADC